MNKVRDNPYMGPRFFKADDKDYFYGRRQEIAALKAYVIAEPLVLLHSPSGAGKSSLIRAGLVPALKESGFDVGLKIGRLVDDPSHIKRVDNIFVFNLLWSLADAQDTSSALQKMTLLDYVQTLGDPQTADGKSAVGRLLVVDQFEEILTTHPERRQEREQFFFQLGQVVRQSADLWVLLAIREEYVAVLQPYAHYLPEGFEARYYLQPLLPEAAREAIEEPAKLGERPFAPGVASTLVKNLRQVQLQGQVQSGQFVEPVQLQIVCSQLWQKLRDRPGDSITQEDIKGLGGAKTAVNEALSQFYQQTLATVCEQYPISEFTLRCWFTQKIITTAHTRGRVPQGHEETGGISNQIIDTLTNEHLIRADTRGNTVWYELIHDRFIEAILQDNDRWLRTHPLFEATVLWHEMRDPRHLFFAQKLEDVQNNYSAVDQADPQVKEFLASSREEQKRREEEAQAEKNREKLLTRRKRVRILFILSISCIFFLIAAIVFSRCTNVNRTRADLDSTRAVEQAATANADSTREVNERATAESEQTIAIAQQATANAASTRAEDSRLTAVAARQSAEDQRGTADANAIQAVEQAATANAASTRAVEQAAIADTESDHAVEQRATADTASTQTARQSDLLLSQSLAFRALNVSDLGNDYELAMLLAVEADWLNQREDSDLQTTIDIALSPARDAPDFNLILRGHENAVNDVAFSPDGRFLTSAGADGTVRVWQLDETGIPAIVLTGHEGAVNAVHFVEAKRIMTAGEDGRILVWDLTNEESEPELVVQEETAVAKLNYIPDGPAGHRYLATSRSDGIVNLWDLDHITPTPVPLATADNNIRPIEFFAQGGYFILVGQANSTIQQWPVFNPFQEPVNRASFHSSAITALAHNQASRLPNMILASGSTHIYIDYNDVNFTLSTHVGSVTTLDFATNSNLLASGGSDGLVYIWQIPFSNLPIQTFRGHVGAITAVTFSPDDRWLASAGTDGQVRLWRMQRPSATNSNLADLACQQIHRNLTWEEWQFYIDRPLYHATCAHLPIPPEAHTSTATSEVPTRRNNSILLLMWGGIFIAWQWQKERL